MTVHEPLSLCFPLAANGTHVVWNEHDKSSRGSAFLPRRVLQRVNDIQRALHRYLSPYTRHMRWSYEDRWLQEIILAFDLGARADLHAGSRARQLLHQPPPQKWLVALLLPTQVPLTTTAHHHEVRSSNPTSLSSPRS